MMSIASTLHENIPLIEVADGVLLDVIAADPQARPLILVRLSDRVAIIAPGGFDALLARLRKLGHLPHVVEE
jgi:hypothetical protein